jgi:hypothetical protein
MLVMTVPQISVFIFQHLEMCKKTISNEYYCLMIIYYYTGLFKMNLKELGKMVGLMPFLPSWSAS